MNNLDERLYRILQKCASSHEFADSALHEASIGNLIIEQIDPNDIREVQDALKNTRDMLDKLTKFAKQLRLDQELKEFFDYIKDLEGALDKGQASLANINFDRGAIMNFFGSKVSLPDLASAAIILNARVADFANGFLRAIGNIQDNLIPVLRSADDSETLAAAAGANPNIDLNNIVKGLRSELKKSLGGTMFGKVKSFFQKGVGSQAGSQVLKALPKRDMAKLADVIASVLVNAKIENLLGQAPEPDDSSVTDLADEMKDIADAAPQEGEEDDPDAEPADTPEDVDADLEAAAREAAETSKSPTDGALDTLDSWVEKLSNSSQKSIKGAGRLDSLKKGIQDRLEASGDIIAVEIEDAIKSWRDEHEETLLKSKRFSKKNFDTLQKLVPQLGSHMLKQVGENSSYLTKTKIKRFVHEYLSRSFARYNRIDESTKNNRWQKLAGLDLS